MRVLLLLCALVSGSAFAGGYYGGFGNRGHHSMYPCCIPVYGNISNHSLIGYGSAGRGSLLTFIGARTPDPEWTPMFSARLTSPRVEGYVADPDSTSLRRQDSTELPQLTRRARG